MNTSGLFISSADIKSLTNEQQAFLFSLVGGNGSIAPVPIAEARSDSNTSRRNSDDPHFAELSPGQARDFYAGCNDKTRKAIDVIARNEGRFFQLADIASAVGVKAPDLKGVWSGLTRRIRTITGDSHAYLIDWTKGEAVFDDDGNYVDQRGEVTALTHNSFKKTLGLL